jgi:hypothetical protein
MTARRIAINSGLEVKFVMMTISQLFPAIVLVKIVLRILSLV